MDRFVSLLLLAFSMLPGAGVHAEERAEGRWSASASGKTLFILEVVRDSDAPGGWAGKLVRPKRMSLSPPAIWDVSLPILECPITGASDKGDRIELEIGCPDDGPERFELQFRNGYAEFGFMDAPFYRFHFMPADAGETVAEDWDADARYSLDVHYSTNAEMKAMFDADQLARSQPGPIDWDKIEREDAERRVRTRELLASDALQSGSDLYHAAFVFQHGSDAEDHLLAHSLAMAAIARGRADGLWIAAASLDRYLRSIGQPQVFGTQYLIPTSGPVTQDPYDRELVPDSLRRIFNVPVISEQERQRSQMEGQRAKN